MPPKYNVFMALYLLLYLTLISKMGSVMKIKSTIKAAFFATNHPDSNRDGAKQKVSEATDFAVILSCNRKSILDF
jgi:hypothetical protein